MDITPDIPEGRQVIEGYGAGRFRVSGRVHEGSVLVFPERTLAWPVATLAEVTAESLAPVTAGAEPPEILLLGCGPRIDPLPHELRGSLRARGVVVEAMDTGAACRTYNVLLAEARAVAAALIAID